MAKYSYTLAVEDVEKSADFYQKYFNWTAKKRGKEAAWIDTKSPLVFSVIEKNYLYNSLGITAEELPEKSLCTWLYESEEELLNEKERLLAKGLVQIGSLGHFLRDENGRIWELRKEGELI